MLKNEKNYKYILENLIDGIIRVDERYCVEYSNISLALMFGYNDVDDFVSSIKDVRNDLFCNKEDGYYIFDQMIKNNIIDHYEVQMLRHDKSKFTASLSMHVFKDPDTGIAYFEGSIVDINARKKKEEENLVRETAERVNDFKRQFLANVSHEIRTPLNAIIGMSGVLKKSGLVDKQNEYVHVIDTASRNLLHLVSEILDFSKIDSGENHIERETFDLEEMVDEVLSLFDKQILKKNIEVLSDIAEDVPRTLCSDHYKLRQILSNICSNAFKFTVHGEIRVQIFVKDRSADTCTLQFEISDTGIGVPKNQRNGLFDSFRQVDNSMTRQYGGAGLGLAIAQKNVGMLGGTIWIDPDHEIGSKFCFTSLFTLPAKTEVDAPKESGLENVRVLLVAGNDNLVRIVSRDLVGFGCQVRVAKSKAEMKSLLDVSNGYDYDVLLVDFSQDGEELLKLINSYPEIGGWGMKVVAMLPYGMRIDALFDMRSDRFAIVAKPVRRLMLLQRLLNILEKNKVAQNKNGNAENMQWLSGKLILLVEDNEFNQIVALEILDAYGASVVVADNGKVAVDLLQEGGAFDLILMDIQMPIMDGYEATRVIRQDLGMQSLPIVAMTANATASDREMCLEKGMDEYLSKPIDRARLEDVLQKFLIN